MFTSVLVVLLTISIIVNVGCILALWKWARRFAEKWDGAQTQIEHLEQQIGVATGGAIGMGHRIVSLEKKLQALQEKQDNQNGDVFAYGQALQMFDQGADVATVASNCGFSSSEAQLMALVRQQLRDRNTANDRNSTSDRNSLNDKNAKSDKPSFADNHRAAQENRRVQKPVKQHDQQKYDVNSAAASFQSTLKKITDPTAS